MKQSKYFAFYFIAIALAFGLACRAQAAELKAAAGSYKCNETVGSGDLKEASIVISELRGSLPNGKSLAYVEIELTSHPKKIKVQGTASVTDFIAEDGEKDHIYSIATAHPKSLGEGIIFNIISRGANIAALSADTIYSCRRETKE